MKKEDELDPGTMLGGSHHGHLPMLGQGLLDMGEEKGGLWHACHLLPGACPWVRLGPALWTQGGRSGQASRSPPPCPQVKGSSGPRSASSLCGVSWLVRGEGQGREELLLAPEAPAKGRGVEEKADLGPLALSISWRPLPRRLKMSARSPLDPRALSAGRVHLSEVRPSGSPHQPSRLRPPGKMLRLFAKGAWLRGCLLCGGGFSSFPSLSMEFGDLWGRGSSLKGNFCSSSRLNAPPFVKEEGSLTWWV